MIDPAMIAAVLVKETAFLSADDNLEKIGIFIKGKKTSIGLTQSSVKRVKENEDILSDKLGRTNNLSGLTDKQIGEKLLTESESPYFAAVQLRAIYANNVNELGLDDVSAQKKVFEIYNSNGIMVDNPPLYSQKTYGEHVYEYANLFRGICAVPR